jgi:hypothetical protein
MADTQIAEQTADIVADVVEDTIDGVVDVVTVVKNNPIVLAAVGVVGLIAGGSAGYFIAKSQLRSFYEDLSTQEIAEAREFYASLNKVTVDGEPKSPMDILEERHGAEAVAEVVRRYQGVDEEEAIVAAKEEQGQPHDDEVDEAQIRKLLAQAKDPEKRPRTQYRQPDKVVDETVAVVEAKEEVVVEERNVFKESSEFDLEVEKLSRTEDAPYIITHDEFYEGEKEYDTVELTYWAEDGTLVGEDQLPVENTDKVIGDDHMMRFGSGSKDPNVVFVRNDRLETDYEIKRENGSYLEKVLGLGPESEERSLRHSNRNAALRRRREFRRGDE